MYTTGDNQPEVVPFHDISFVPSNLWLEHQQFTRPVVRPTSLSHQTECFPLSCAPHRKVSGNSFTKYYPSTIQISFDIWLIPCYPYPTFSFRAPAPESPCPLTPSPPQSLPNIRQGYSSRQSIATRDPALLIRTLVQRSFPVNFRAISSLRTLRPYHPGVGDYEYPTRIFLPLAPRVGEGAYLPRTGLPTAGRHRDACPPPEGGTRSSANIRRGYSSRRSIATRDWIKGSKVSILLPRVLSSEPLAACVLTLPPAPVAAHRRHLRPRRRAFDTT
jgi:hypothetical protein